MSSQDWNILSSELLRARMPQLAGSIVKNNALLNMLEKGREDRPRPTHIDLLRQRFRDLRRSIGFWIAGYDPADDYDYD